MRSVQLAAITFFFGISLTAYGQPGPEERRIVELESKWSGMFGERDLDGIMSLMAQDSVLLMPGAEPIVGIEDIRRATRTMLASDDQVT